MRRKGRKLTMRRNERVQWYGMKVKEGKGKGATTRRMKIGWKGSSGTQTGVVGVEFGMTETGLGHGMLRPWLRNTKVLVLGQRQGLR
jgi:hypothetical protein